MYAPVKVIEVFIWGRRVGVLTHDYDQYSVFEYDDDFRKTGIELAPFTMPLVKSIYHVDDFGLPRREFAGLPGMIADSLPDSFGNVLIERYLASKQIDLQQITPLDRLAYVGSRGMGALTFVPPIRKHESKPSAVDLRELVEEARLALNERLLELKGVDALREIIRVGTSAGGAQAKAVVGWNRRTGKFLAGTGDLPEGFEHWLVKFAPKGLEDAGEKEYAVYRKAVDSGIEMSECRLLEVDGIKHFMTKRFDREGNHRLHLQTYCALKHIPHSAPRETKTYEGIFHTIVDLGLDYAALEQMFRRMVFNIKIGECDDHTKNFSFLMSEDGKWSLAPAYDLTGYHVSVSDKDFSAWSNPHALSVNGKTGLITDDDLLLVAERFGIGTAPRILREITEVVK